MASALKGLQGVLSKKPAAAPAVELPEADILTVRVAGRAGRPSKDDRVQVMLRVFPEERKALRQIALDADTTVQELVESVVRDLITRHQGHGAVRTSGGPAVSSERAVEADPVARASHAAEQAPAGRSNAPEAMDLPGVRWPKGTSPDEAHVMAQLVRELRPSTASRPLATRITTETGIKVSHEFVESLARAQGIDTARRRT